MKEDLDALLHSPNPALRMCSKVGVRSMRSKRQELLKPHKTINTRSLEGLANLGEHLGASILAFRRW